MKFYSSKIAVSKPISLEQAAANARQQPQVRTLEEIIASTKQIKAAAANATVKTAAVQVKVAQDFAEAPQEPINPDPVTDVAPPAPVGSIPPAPTSPTPVPGISPDPLAKPMGAAPLPPPAPAGAPMPPELQVPPAPLAADPLAAAPMGKAPIGLPPAPKAAPAPMPIASDPLDIAASSKRQLKMAKSINFTAWPEEQKVIDHWKSFGSHDKCVAGVNGKTNDAATYCTYLEKAAEIASDQLVKKAASAKGAKIEKNASPAFKRFAKLTEKEQAFLRDFFSKIYGKEYVTALLGDY